MSTRQCGNCTVCCFVPAVPELEKPINTWCHHCEISQGCKIYEKRPQQCKDFNCLWLTNFWMDDELRPDKSGIMFESVESKRTIVASVDPERHMVGQNPLVQQAIENLVVSGRPIIITSTGHDEPLTILPDGWTHEEAWRGNRSVHH